MTALEAAARLLGALSNQEIQTRLRQLSEKLTQVAADGAAPRRSGRVDHRLRGGLGPQAIERVLASAGEPMRARDVHAAVEKLLGRSVSWSSVKNWLTRSIQGDGARVARVG